MEIILFGQQLSGMDSPWRREADSKGLTVCQLRHIETSFLQLHARAYTVVHRDVLGPVAPECQKRKHMVQHKSSSSL